jgi:hypothetical protein
LNTVEKQQQLKGTILRLLSLVQEAICILETEYQSRLSQAELDSTIDYFSNKTKASIFIAISSTSRDC